MMMTKDEALKLALEALKQIDEAMPFPVAKLAQAAIKEALAQPEQEPKCGAIIEVFGKDWRLEYLSLPVGKHKLYTQQYTYTTPEQEPVGQVIDERGEVDWISFVPNAGTELYASTPSQRKPLTDAEINKIRFEWLHYDERARAIEAKLKEKNT